MSKIVIGKAGKKDVALDLDILLRTRLLVQANSGGGKSWLLRRLAEQLFGKIPVIIIDPEGEFATLREKFGYVLVGKGGETPADSRSAALVAHKLLELRASAVCDLYELKPAERHHWTKLFLDGFTNSPKNLWRPTIVMVDEAHTFCPEKGESEASDAMVDSTTRWRKRRFCAIWATQRLAKVRKDASSELLNRLVGSTFEDVDLKRAAELLSIRSEDRRKFDAEMRVLEPGNFFALGRAICKERLLVRVGAVMTSHEIEDAKHGTEPPPAPEKVKLLLPKLKDLPQAAEEQAKTVAEFKSEIRSLKAQLRGQPQPAAGKTLTREVRVADPKAIEAARKMAADVKAQYDRQLITVHASEKALRAHGGRLAKALVELGEAARKQFGGASPELKPITLPKIPSGPAPAAAPRPAAQGSSTLPARSTPVSIDGLKRGAVRMLTVLAQWHPEPRTADQLGALSGFTVGGGTWSEYTGALRRAGYINVQGETIYITDEGLAAVPTIPSKPETSEQLIAMWKTKFKSGVGKMLDFLVARYPDWTSREDLMDNTFRGGTFSEYYGALRRSRLVEEQGGRTRAAASLMEVE